MVTFKTGGGVFYIDEGRYKMTLRDVVEEEGRSFDGKPPQPRNKWVFSPVVNAEGQVMENDNGLPLEYFEFTGQSIGAKSNARPLIEALLGKSIEGLPAETVLDEISQGLGKLTAAVLIADQLRADGETQSRAVKGSWKPITGGRAPARQAAPAAAPRGDEVPF